MMESLEATEVVYEKICRSEPENIAQKIIGYILVQDHGEQEMLRLAFSPISAVQKTIQEAKTNLGLNSNTFFTLDRTPFSPTPSQPFPSAATFQPQIENSDFLPFSYSFPITNNDDSILLNQPTVNSGNQLQPSSFPGAHYYPRSSLRNLSIRGARNSLRQPEFPVKACHYFNKGFCKHGNNCRYSHRRSVPDVYPNWNDFSGEDQVLSPKTLEKLEWEIKEILNSRRASPVSIASLPMMYSDKYGKSLQAEGYLTESRRHGKAGYSLTRLLSHMNTIRLIDRPHGQHSVILAEDAPKYMEHWSERNEPWPIVSGSRQIYLTFPAESTFSEDDVSDYFNTFGEVQDVRIPCQQKRMFGFVTFESADTVKTILSKGNPHFVCGARVLVKPYREKSKAVDRKYHDRHDPSMYYQLHHSDVETELHARWVPSSLIRKKFMEEQEQAMEVERRRFSEMRSVRKPMSNQSYVGCSPDELKLSEDDSGYPSIEQFNYPLDVWDGASRSQDNPNRINANYAYDVQESGTGLELPENPFASPVATGIPTAV